MKEKKYFNELEKSICELANDHLVTPFNLLNNARLKNYSYVKYYTENNFLISEMEFEVRDKKHIFFYYFDNNNRLEKICEEILGERKIRFSRKEELEKSIDIYNSLTKEKIS